MLAAPIAGTQTALAATDGDNPLYQTTSGHPVSQSMQSSEIEDVIISGETDEELYNDIAAEEEIIVHSGMSLRTSQTALDYFSVYSDAPFRKPATTYNHKLARMSICMATCANRPIPYSSDIELKPDQYLVQYLQDCGFTNLREDDYDKTPSLYTVATAIGSKQLTDDDGEPFTLIAVGVCGGNYKKEWLSNVTLGLGERHQGFDSAARTVTDRIFGYLGTNHITGRVKIWIAGFSRAAAVSNVTAANLVDSTVFRQDDIYAYTFATPRTTKNYGAEGYENIFNIVGSMDMVPQMAPAYWGFGRYGNDLVLPGQEVDSDFARKYALIQEGFETKYHAVTNYNPKLNFCLRLLIGMSEELVPNQEEYDMGPQEGILSILEDKSPENVLRVMRRLTVATKDHPQEKWELEDRLVEYVGRLATGIVIDNGEFEKNRNMGSTGSRVFHEHIEDLYLMWMNSGLSPEELFEHPDTFTYLIVIGSPALTVEDSKTGEQLYTISSAGKAIQLEAAKKRNLSLAIETFRNTDVEETLLLMALPHDADYRVTWTVERDEGALALAIPCAVAISPSMDSIIRDTPDTAKIGDTGLAYEAHGSEIVVEDTLEYELPASQIAWMVGVDRIKGGWRMTIMKNILILCVILILLRAIVAIINRWGSSDHWRRRFFFSSIVMLGLVESEACYWLFAATPQIRLIWKAIAGVAVLGYCISCRQPGSKWFWGIFTAMFLCTAGDLVINFWFLPGVVLFGFAHVFLIWLFLKIRPLRITTWVWWVLLSLVTAIVVLILTANYELKLGIGASVYASILILMLMTGQHQNGNLRLGSFLFFVSDTLLGFYTITQKYPYVHMVYMALYYLALLIMCRSLIDEEVFIAKDGKVDFRSLFKKLLGKKDEEDDDTPEDIEELAGAIGDAIID